MTTFIPFQYFPVKELILVPPRVIPITKAFQAFKEVHAYVIPHPSKYRLLHLQAYMPITISTSHDTFFTHTISKNEFPFRFYYVTKIANIIQIYASFILYIMFFNGAPQKINNPPHHGRVANPAPFYRKHPVVRNKITSFYSGPLHEVAVFWLVSISGLSSSGIWIFVSASLTVSLTIYSINLTGYMNS